MKKKPYKIIILITLISFSLIIIFNSNSMDNLISEGEFNEIQVFVVFNNDIDRKMKTDVYEVKKVEELCCSSIELVNILREKEVLSKKAYLECTSSSISDHHIDRIVDAKIELFVHIDREMREDLPYIIRDVYLAPKRKWYNAIFYYQSDRNLDKESDIIDVCKFMGFVK